MMDGIEHLRSYIVNSEQNTNDVQICECCFHVGELEICNNGHGICLQCINSICELEVNKTESTGNSIQCPVCESTTCIPINILSKTEKGIQLLREYFVSEFKSVIIKKLEENKLEDFLFMLPFLKSDGTTKALACPICEYGPIIHAHCSDLLIHHGQDSINNSCPKCGALTFDSRSLISWNP